MRELAFALIAGGMTMALGVMLAGRGRRQRDLRTYWSNAGGEYGFARQTGAACRRRRPTVRVSSGRRAINWIRSSIRHVPARRILSERTLVLIKPDGVSRGLIGDVVSRIERKGLRIVAMELRTLDRETAVAHYAEHLGKPFFDSLAEFITSAPLVAMVVEGPRAIETVRTLAGATDPVNAAPGTIRGDYGLEVQQNIVHGSDSRDSADREIKIFFPELV
jgi:nucleoside-diphosphate kinase